MPWRDMFEINMVQVNGMCDSRVVQYAAWIQEKHVAHRQFNVGGTHNLYHRITLSGALSISNMGLA